MFVMPAYSRGANSLGTKLVTLFPDNDKKGIPSHLGIILLFNASTGQLQAVRNYYIHIHSTYEIHIFYLWKWVANPSPFTRAL